jgi:hypothetical protein
MNKEMMQFYNDKNILISEVMRRGGKQMLTEPQIIEGLQVVYDRVEAGEQIKDISLVWEAWQAARQSQGTEYLEWCLSRDEYMQQIKELKTAAVDRKMKYESIIWSILAISACFGILWWAHV